MFAIRNFSFLITLYLSYGISIVHLQCAPDTVDFKTKVTKSSIVIYGKVMAKTYYEEDVKRFHVFFQVDCILKGSAISRTINIINAGEVNGRLHCQELPAGHGYSIVFLEPISSNITDSKTFMPADFAEVPFEYNSTDKLLARVCDLQQIAPLSTSIPATVLCPAVGTSPTCTEVSTTTMTTATDTLIYTKITTEFNDLRELSNETVIISFNDKDLSNQIFPEDQNMNRSIFRVKSGASQIDVDQKSGSTTMTYSILFMMMTLLVCFYQF